MLVLPKGVHHIPEFLDGAQQRTLIQCVRDVTRQAPLFVPTMPRTGKPMSVRMTNCGDLGWVTDQSDGYRYQKTHPVTGNPWPKIPELLQQIWSELSGYPAPAEACLINYYDPAAKMGLHQDRDEDQFDAPVLSISLGDDCLFKVGGSNRRDRTVSLRLRSGDVVLLSGESRLAFHGVSRIYPGTSSVLKREGRINLTLRRVTEPR